MYYCKKPYYYDRVLQPYILHSYSTHLSPQPHEQTESNTPEVIKKKLNFWFKANLNTKYWYYCSQLQSYNYFNNVEK